MKLSRINSDASVLEIKNSQPVDCFRRTLLASTSWPHVGVLQYYNNRPANQTTKPSLQIITQMDRPKRIPTQWWVGLRMEPGRKMEGWRAFLGPERREKMGPQGVCAVQHGAHRPCRRHPGSYERDMLSYERPYTYAQRTAITNRL